ARLFAYGFLSVILVLYLAQVGLSDAQIGLLLSLTLVGDTFISLRITTTADRVGRRRMLILGAGLMIFAGVLFALTSDFILQLIANERRTSIFAWYNLVGSFATAFGALCGGGLTQFLQGHGFTILDSYRAIVIGYAVVGLLLALLFTRLSAAAEAPPRAERVD